MAASDETKKPSEPSINLDQLLEQREQIEAMIRNKFTKIITIMFTDLKGSTSLAESQGDVATRLLIKRHNDILFPAIAEQGGVLVKTMGDGTLSYFLEATGAVRAAVQVQRGLQEYNRSRPGGVPLLMRVGINTGIGIVEKSDLFGDVVNVASRFETLAEPGEILISESAYEALGEHRDEFCVRLKMTTKLKGKGDLFKAFRVYLSPEELAAEPVSPSGGPAESDVRRGADRATAPVQGATLGPADQALLDRAKALEAEGEFPQLQLLCDGAPGPGPLVDIAGRLRATLDREQPVECRLLGEAALWFHKPSISLGRTPNADFPLTNQAISRVPLRFGVADGRGVFSVPSRGTPFKPVEIDREGEREQVRPDQEYPLAGQGWIILSGCFPIKWRLHEGRFLVLKILDPGQELKRLYHGQLRDIWRGFDQESRNLLVVGG